jgi:hypothetical protein
MEVPILRLSLFPKINCSEIMKLFIYYDNWTLTWQWTERKAFLVTSLLHKWHDTSVTQMTWHFIFLTDTWKFVSCKENAMNYSHSSLTQVIKMKDMIYIFSVVYHYDTPQWRPSALNHIWLPCKERTVDTLCIKQHTLPGDKTAVDTQDAT